MKTFQNKLEKFEKSDIYPFHMPGHKRIVINTGLKNPYTRDITEIDGYDNLHNPTDFILEEEKFAADLFGAEESFYLVNGSTCGILSAIMTVSNRSQKLLVTRNCHKAVFNGLYLAETAVEYIYPVQQMDLPFQGSVSVDDIAERLKKEKYAGIIITSPTYEGIVSDIASICRMAHQYQIPVIVDEAHGAHFSILSDDQYFPESSVCCGADIVIQSVHKTLPSMTQTALLHVQGNLIDRDKLKHHLAVFQTSSPSYILMESISDALHYCSDNQKQLTEKYKKQLMHFYKNTESLKNLYLNSRQISRPDFAYKIDPGKLVIGINKNIRFSGRQLSNLLLEKYRLQMEMAEEQYVIAMTSIMDTDDGFCRLLQALLETDQMLSEYDQKDNMEDEKDSLICQNGAIPRPDICLTIRDALSSKTKKYGISEATGKISAEFIYLYPPGIPIVVPGERITKECVDYLTKKKEAGLSIQGPAEYEKGILVCVSDE